ncbi:neuropeptide FF receptor 2-like [Acropora palmata]|uniref:neuropeptide FF receptor 2-like n=1 Tax=Acropora palmata TaxID=6131 RepID=UPI003DA00E16
MTIPVTTNFSVNQTLNSTLYPTRSQEQLGNGKTQLNAWTIVQLLAFYAMLLLSLIGNTLVIKAVTGNRKTTTRQLHYLFIVNLSVADLLFAVENIPIAFAQLILNGAWKIEGNFGSFLCKFDFFLSLVVILTSNLTILATGVERFHGIFYPLKTFSSKKCAYVIIASTWLVSGIYALPLFSSAFAYLQRSPDGNMRCNLCIECDKVIQWFIFQTVLVATAFAATLILYSAIGVKIWRRKTPGFQLERFQIQAQTKKIRALKMLAMLVTVFYISFIPFFVLQLSIFFGFLSKLGAHYGKIAAFLMYCNGAINPLIYGIYNERIREEFKALFKSKKLRRSCFCLSFETTRRPPAIGLQVKQLQDAGNQKSSYQSKSTFNVACSGEANQAFPYEETRL